ncbi:MAG: hypothetical protein ABFR33_05910 [Verrucomicrobiota bacterium]
MSAQSIIRWEQTDGKIAFRDEDTAAAMQQIRGMNKTQAWEALE